MKIIDNDVDIVFATSGYLNAFKMGKLYQKSCFLISKNTTEVQEEINLIYKGNVVAKGDKASFYKQIKDVGRNYYKEEKLVDVLEEMEDNVWQYFEKVPASGTHYETKGLIDKYTSGNSVEFEKGVNYLTEKERESYEIFVQHDKIVDIKGDLVDTNGSVSIIGEDIISTNKAIFVMSEKGNIYFSKYREVGKFHHSSFLAGKPVSAAGEILIEKGVIKSIDNGSGHYRPSLEMVEKNVFKELSDRYYFSTGQNTKDKIKFNQGF